MNVYHVPYIADKKYDKIIKVKVPGSKSITNRALLLAAMADGKSEINGVLFSDDSRHFLKCLKQLGFRVEIDEATCRVCVIGHGGAIPKKEASIYVGSAGTAARFLTAFLGLSCGGKYHIDASEQMKRRPMKPLFECLKQSGATVVYHEKEGHLPVTLMNNGESVHRISVNIETSSQFLSALLICAPLYEKEVAISIEGKHGMSYIEMTVFMMKQFGIEIKKENSSYYIKRGMKYHAKRYAVEPDVSAACYFYALAPLMGCQVIVTGVHASSMQGDIKFLDILKKMGSEAVEEEAGILLKGINGTMNGGETDLGNCSDQTMTLAAIAPFAKEPTVIRNISHIKYQESDRIAATLTELRRLGCKCEEIIDGIKIYPSKLHSAEIETYDDHRMAMAFALTGLKVKGVVVKDPQCCAKTFENYFEVLDSLTDRILFEMNAPGIKAYDKRPGSISGGGVNGLYTDAQTNTGS